MHTRKVMRWKKKRKYREKKSNSRRIDDLEVERK